MTKRNSPYLLVVGTVFLAAPAFSQWTNTQAKGIPRLSDGKPNLFAPAPKSADGTLDLSGTWWVPWNGVEGSGGPGPKYAGNLAADLRPEDVALLPEAAALFAERVAARGKDLPATRCVPPGLPLSFTIPSPFKIIQTTGLTAVLSEYANSYRQIFTDGRAFPDNPNPAWLGYSTGRWEGATFVVETIGFNDKTWLDLRGHPHTESLRLIERYRRLDFGHMNIEITIDDPKAYKKPWIVNIGAELVPDTDLIEYVCGDNEKDVAHLVGK